MPSKYPQYFIDCPFAEDGDKTIPPETSQTAGTGRLSQEKGWTEVNSMPIAEGGIPPNRLDFNGALYLLSQLLYWIQQGGLFNYATDIDYEVGNEVLLSNVKYRCIQANGPSSTVVSPTASNGATYWANQDVGAVRYDQVQSLSAEQQQQARENIGAIQGSDITGFVRFDKAQSLNGTQQAQARTNIGAQSASDVQQAVQNGVSQVHSSFVRAMGVNATVSIPIAGSQISVIVFAQARCLLDNNSPSLTYTVYLNNSSIGTITLNWESQRTGGAGFGRHVSLSDQGYLYSARTISANAQVKVTRTGTNGVETVMGEFVQVAVY